jgi:hypothetical protein
LNPFCAVAPATIRPRLAAGNDGSASTAGTSTPREGALGSWREGSRTFVTNAQRAERVTPNHVPPALRSRPASQPSSHHAARDAGRA